MSISVDSTIERVFSYIDRNRERFVEDLRKLLRQPSISAQNIGLEDCAELVAELMQQKGIPAQVMPLERGPPIVFGEVKSKSSNRTLVCYAHYDVQPPEPLDQWISPPFSAEIRDATVFARGATDDKSAILAFLAATEAFMKDSGDIPVNLKFVFEGEEEVGSPHFDAWATSNRALAQGDGLIAVDGSVDPSTGRPPLVFGFGGGGGYFELHANTEAKGDTHAGEANFVTNAAWRLVWALSTIKDQNERILIEGWYDDAPRSLPLQAVEWLDDWARDFDEEKTKRHFGVNEFLLGRTGRDLLRARMFDPTCTIAGIEAGYTGPGSKTIVPSKAMARIDCRSPFPIRDPLGKLRRHLEKHGFSDVKVVARERKPLRGKGPEFTSPEAAVSKAVINAALKVFGKKPVFQGMQLTRAEGVYRVMLDVPAVITRFGAPGDNIHAPNENIPIDTFIRGIKYTAAIMAYFATS